MINKKGMSAWIWILIGFFVALAIVLYFLFFSMSESKAKNIVEESYYKDQSKICSRFFVNNERCREFSKCYIEEAIVKMDTPLLKKFAQDINAGRASAFDSYSLINGKNIGENCLVEILGMPENTNLNLINVE